MLNLLLLYHALFECSDSELQEVSVGVHCNYLRSCIQLGMHSHNFLGGAKTSCACAWL